MSRIGESNLSDRDRLLGEIENIKGCDTVEEVAQKTMDLLYERFEESIVLARVFATVPFEKLPSENRDFVAKLASSAGISTLMSNTTPTLSLLGTRGMSADWNDRRKSEGHVGIPLASGSFVSTIPMMSRLLKQLGLDLEWIDQWDTKIVSEASLSTFAGTFYVEDARLEKDSQGRKVIAGQDFVSKYGVKTVFGFGGSYLGRGTFVVTIVFTRDIIEKSLVERFQVLVNAFKMASMDQISTGRIFK
ncbi:hypothetical protein ACFL2Q_01965 [Thermodesulfobacteriota bacterium]